MNNRQKTDPGYSIRENTIVALQSNPQFGSALVLKGGNALRMVHQVGERTSQDLDFSAIRELGDENILGQILRESLKSHFIKQNLEVFDFKLERRPKASSNGEFGWGGYYVKFKVLEVATFLKKGLQKSQILASNVDRCIEVEISRGESTEGTEFVFLGKFPIQVASKTAIGFEKMRALCQQLPAYTLRSNKTMRARDFYDIANLLELGVDFSSPEAIKIAKSIFTVKRVERDLLLQLGTEEVKRFHRDDWDSVVSTVTKRRDYDECVARVADLARNLHSLWDIDLPE